MSNGFMSKAAAGLGQGMAAVGEIGLKAKLLTNIESMKTRELAKREERLQFYLDQRNQADNVSRERIADAGNVARRDLKLEERGWQQEDTEAKRLVDAEGLVSKQDFDLEKLDYEHKLRKDLEGFKAKHGTTTTSSLIQNVNFLVEKEIAATPRAAFEMLRTSVEKPEHEAILDLATKLRGGYGYGGKGGIDKSMQDATRMVQSLRGTAPGMVRAQEEDDNPPTDIEAGSRRPPRATAPGAKVQDYSDEDLQFTAKKHGLSVDEVKRRLGVR